MKAQLLLLTIILMTGFSVSVYSQPDSLKPSPVFERNLSGPRLGLTLVPSDDEIGKFLDHEGMNRTVSQFGWHTELQVTTRGGGPSFLVEFIPLIGGVEYGKRCLCIRNKDIAGQYPRQYDAIEIRNLSVPQ